MVSANIVAGSRLTEGRDLQPIATALTNGSLVINNRSLCDLLGGSRVIFESFSTESVTALTSLTRTLVERAAVLAGVMTYLSVAPQLKAGVKRAIISLDSSMGRYFPGYFDIMKRRIADLTPSGHEVETVLVHPIQLPNGGDISVPLQGAALLLESSMS